MKRLVLLGLGLLAATLAARTASAFTTGGHFLATERGLRRAGLDPEAIRHVQAANYGVDHFVNLKSEVLFADSNAQRASNVARFFHFDALHTPGYVEREFAFLDKAVRTVVLDAKARRDPRRILTTLGIASHALQDFYSHSNVADVDWLAWKGSRVITFDDLPRDLYENPLFTGRWAKPDDAKGLLSGAPSGGGPYGASGDPRFPGHGNAALSCTSEGYKECGVNHDGARRRANLTALLMASEATYDLAERVKALVSDPALWEAVVRPGFDVNVNGAWDRAQAMSAAAAQWGFEGKESVTQILIAFAASSAPPAHAFQFDAAWVPVLLSLWSAAPTAHAMGGGADPYPPNAAPLFGVPGGMTTGTAPFAGSYTVLWGGRRGGLVLAPSPPSELGGTLTIDGRTYVDERIELRGGALDLNFTSADRTIVVSGRVHPTGPNRELAGYLRGGASGVPDGFLAVKAKNQSVAPVLPTVKAR